MRRICRLQFTFTMGYSDRGTPGQKTGQDLLGAMRADIESSIARSQAKNAATSTIIVDEPTPCTPDFVLDSLVENGKIKPLMCASIPTATQTLRTWIIRDADCADQATFDSSQLRSDNEPDADARAANHYEYFWDGKLLQPSTLYRLIYLVAIGEDGKIRNPIDDVAFNDAPLATFTTPAAFAAALSKPHVGNIIENNLDDATSRKFDAWVVVQIFAPASASSAATGTVSTSVDSTTVTGSGTAFLTDFPNGSAIIVNGETHLVSGTPASNTSLTVDFPFKTANSGQAATKVTLNTFDGAGVKAIAPKFRLVDDADARRLAPHFAIGDDEGTLTNIKVRVSEFYAARLYDWIDNLAIGEGGARVSSTPSSTQRFTAGNFTTPTAGIPEWTTAPFFQYDATEPANDNKRNVSLRITQISPPVAIDKIELYRRNAGTGTISGSTTTITGSGTAFLTELAKGHYIIASGQTLEVSNISSDTSLTVVTAPSPSISGVSWTKSVDKSAENNNYQVGKFHPSAGGLVPPVKFGEIKTKKLVAYTYAAVIYALNGVTRTVTDTFTPDGEAADDTGVPSGLAAPVLSWSAEGKLKAQGMQATTNIHTLKKRYLVIHNNAGTYFDLVTRTTAANEAAARYEISAGHATLDWVKLKRLRNVFGTSSPTNVYAYWYAENDFGVSAASSNSNAIDLTSQYDFMDGSTDTVGGLSPGTQAVSTVNVIYNGHFTYGTATITQLWQRRDKTTWATVNDVDTTNTNAIYWDTTNHRAIWQDEAERLTTSIGKRQIPGDYYTVSALVKSNGTPTVDIECIIRDNSGNNDTADDGDVTVNPTVSVTLSSTYQFLVWRMRLKTSADASVKHHLSFETASAGVSGSNQIIIDAVMMVRGKTAAAFSFHPKDQNNAGGGDEDFDVTAASTGVTGNLGNPVDTFGGYPGIGDGAAVPLL